MKVYSAQASVYGNRHGDMVDVSPQTGDALGRTISFQPASVLHQALVVRYMSGAMSKVEMAALEMLVTWQVSHSTEQTQACHAAMARFGKRVTVVCDCDQHANGSCLRHVTARMLASMASGGEDRAYQGDLRSSVAGRLSARIVHPVASQLSPAEWAAMQTIVSAPEIVDRLRGVWGNLMAWRERRAADRGLPPFATRLGLAKWPCQEAELKAAWRQLAMKHHPDRGGDEAEFKALSAAYAEALAALRRRW